MRHAKSSSLYLATSATPALPGTAITGRPSEKGTTGTRVFIRIESGRGQNRSPAHMRQPQRAAAAASVPHVDSFEFTLIRVHLGSDRHGRSHTKIICPAACG